MWSDSLIRVEQLHLLRLLAWGGVSVLAGTLLLLVPRLRGARSPLLHHFSLQTVAWGGITLALAGLAWRSLAMRDHAGAVRLDRLVWLNVGLDAGYVGVGATLAVCGWMMGRRLGPVGAGLAIIVQGLALALLDLRLASAILR